MTIEQLRYTVIIQKVLHVFKQSQYISERITGTSQPLSVYTHACSPITSRVPPTICIHRKITSGATNWLTNSLPMVVETANIKKTNTYDLKMLRANMYKAL